MEKTEYIEYCRQLFENPLLEIEKIRKYKDEIRIKLVFEHEYFIANRMIPFSSELPRKWCVYRPDFEQGGKYYEGVEDGA